MSAEAFVTFQRLTDGSWAATVSDGDTLAAYHAPTRLGVYAQAFAALRGLLALRRVLKCPPMEGRPNG